MNIVLQLVLGVMRLTARQAAGRLVATSALLLAAGLFAMVGFAGFGAAAWIALARRMDPLLAALIMGAAGFLIAALLLLTVRLRARRSLWDARSLAESPEVASLLKMTEAEHGTAAVWVPLVGVALAGFLLGRGGRGG